MTVPVTRGLDVDGALPRLRKAGLAVEILAAYVPALRRLRRDDLRSMVAAARAEWPGDPMLADPRSAARTAQRLAQAVERTFRVVPTDTRCLISALTLSRLLARRGIDSTLVVAARTEPEFAAHAWVEHAGFPLLDPGGPGHQRLVEL